MKNFDFNIVPIDFSELVRMTLDGNLIPVFGAGFTAGCQAANGIVPNGNRAKQDMINMIMSNDKEQRLTKDELDCLDFFAVADLFFEYVNVGERAQYFEDKFTDVKLYKHCADFLRFINWPYAYTINVDDAIEKNSDFTEMLPYHKFNRPKTFKRILYKLHGDAVYECKYVNSPKENIIFSQMQYIQAMNSEQNSDIYKALMADFSEKNLLFIGCQLEKEIDIKNIFSTSRSFAKETYRFVIRTKKPDIQEEINLKSHGINRVLLVDNYEKFYEVFLSEYKKSNSIKNRDYAYTNPKIKKIDDKEESIRLISGMDIFNYGKNEFMKGSLHVLRNVVSSTIEFLKTNNIILLKGRRFSGKTFALCSLIEQYRNYDALYFPSATFIDKTVVESLLEKRKKSIFLFDSNSLSAECYSIILECEDKLCANDNKIIIAANSNDNFLLSKIEGELFEIDKKFDVDELSSNKRVADIHGLVRRNPNDTNIDYLYRIKSEQRIDIPLINVDSISFTPKERAILIALCSLDKLFFSDIIALGMQRNEFKCLCKKMTPFIEEVEVDIDEKERHSRTKLVHNGKLALIDILSKFTFEEISKGITYIVHRFKPDKSRKRLYIEIILFDTMNQIFSPVGKDHVEKRVDIPKIYEELQQYLSDDLHYWLQRAKSIYRTTMDLDKLSDAYSYAMKTYKDSRSKTRLYISAALTLALILCAMGENEKGVSKLSTYEEALLYADEAVTSDVYRKNPRYLNSQLPKGKNTNSEKRILAACCYVTNNSKSTIYKQKAEQLKAYFEE